jgi:hypothetical protein
MEISLILIGIFFDKFIKNSVLHVIILKFNFLVLKFLKNGNTEQLDRESIIIFKKIRFEQYIDICSIESIVWFLINNLCNDEPKYLASQLLRKNDNSLSLNGTNFKISHWSNNIPLQVTKL